MSSLDSVSRASASFRALLLASSWSVFVGCGGEARPTLTRAELLDPQACESCHPEHYIEWSGSMHAYAADDPVFLAMNARGQRETAGELGDFCVRCHAPMAVSEGLTTDGLNLDELPREVKGVTCYFCHQVDAVEGLHNNPLSLAEDVRMRGGLSDAIGNDAHRSSYSRLHDRERAESSDMCGACHDIVTPAGVHLERTFAEWKDSLFGSPEAGQQLSCSKCHMTGRDGYAAAVEGAPERRVHEHTFAGVDVALIDWPEKEAQLAAIQRDLDPTVLSKLCVAPAGGGVRVDVTLENFLAGHMWPSGAAQDRRAWVELRAFVGDNIVFESGVVAEGEALTSLDDSDLWLLRDEVFDADGQPAHMFWDVRSYESELLTPPVTNDPADPRFYHASTRSYQIAGQVPDRIHLRLLIRPLGLDVLEDLVDSGDLTTGFETAIPTFSLAGAELEWTAADGFVCVP